MKPGRWAAVTDDAARRQGGDLRGMGADGFLDLGTCVNRYGPPPSVADAIQRLDVRELLAHPYGAEQRFAAAYADYMRVSPDHLVPGRGITEFIRLLSDVIPVREVAVITPDYTDTIRTFPIHLGPMRGRIDTVDDRMARVSDAMQRFRYVFFSNPNNPLGLYLHQDDLIELCKAHPESTLIIDEAYIDFMADHPHVSMTHSGLDNLVVLRSPNKLFGIAGARTGALWTLNDGLRKQINSRRLNWGLSYLDVAVAFAALGETGWAEQTRGWLLNSARELDALLGARLGAVIKDVPVHYRFVPLHEPQLAYQHLIECGIVVRLFSGTESGRMAGLRITAPTVAETPRVVAALTDTNRHL